MSAAESVLALVSGLTRAEREARAFMVLQACIDGSQADGDVLILAGYLAPVRSWVKFSEKWDAALAGPPRWHQLKSKGAKRKLLLDQEFRRRYINHYNIILEHVHASICVAIPLRAFEKVCNEFGLDRKARNPYFIAFNTLISLYVGHAEKSGISDSIELVFDDQTERPRIESAWDYYYAHMPARYKKKIESRPSFKIDGRFKPLQAADLIASWMRERFLERGTIVDELGPLVPWETKKADHAHIYGELPEAGIRSVMEKQFSGRVGVSASYRLPFYGAGWEWNR